MLGKRLRLFLIIVMVIFSILLTLTSLEVLIRWQEKILPVKKEDWSSLSDAITDNAQLQKMVKDKKISEKTFNIYYFGESSMWGEPYRDTIPILVEKMLQGKVDGKEIKWINMASPGINLGECERRVRQVIDGKAVYFPSLIVVYAGHNEFLQFHDMNGFTFVDKDNPLDRIVSKSRLAQKIAKTLGHYKLEIDDRKFFDTAVTEPDRRANVFKDYENQMKSIIDYSKNNKISVLISTVAGNYADFEPDRSVFNGEETKKEEFKNEMDKGREEQNNGKYKEALENYLKAESIDRNFAETNYRLGQIYQKLGNNEKAWEEYSKAVDNDMMPMRTTSFQNDFIRKIPEDRTTKIIDTVAYLRNKSRDTLIGDNFFADGQHPNLDGFTYISENFAKGIAQMYSKNTKFLPIKKESVEEIFNVNDNLVGVYFSRAGWMVRLATWRYDPSQRLVVTEKYLDKGEAIRDDWTYSKLIRMIVAYLRKDLVNANKYQEIARKSDAKVTDDFLKQYWVNQIIRRALN